MPLTEPQARSLVDKMSRRLVQRQPDIRKRNDYYEGRHRLVFASETWEKFHSSRYRHFSDNWCGVVADSPAERLAVSGIRLPEQSRADDDLWRVWQVNAGDAESSAGFIDVQVASRVFVMVWGDPPEITWEAPSECIVAYEPGSRRKRTAALKVWRDGDYEMATLYLPDEVWKFSRTAVSTVELPDTVAPFEWKPRDVDGEPNPQPNPMGVVPIVELPNRPRLNGTTRSEVAGVSAMQDAINLLWAYLFTTADFASFPQRVVMGQDKPKVPILDENGDVVGTKPVPLEKFGQDRVLWLTGKDAKIDQWDAATLTQFTDIVEVQVGHIAAQTRTPQHYLIGKMANLSAEALVAAETGLVKKVEEQQTFLGPRLQEVFRLVALAQGDERKANAVAAGKVLWRDAESRSEHQMADKIIKLRQAGFPFRWIVEEYGVSPTEVARIMSMRDAEMREMASADMAAILGGEQE